MFFKNKNSDEIAFFGGTPDQNIWELSDDQDTAKISMQFSNEKNKKFSDIYNARIIAQYSNIIFEDITYAATERAVNNLFQAVFLLDNDSLKWLDISGNEIILSLDKARQLLQLMRIQQDDCYVREANLKKQVNDCCDITSLETININFN